MVSRQSPQDLSSPTPAGWLALFVGGNGARTFVLAGGLAVHAISVFVVATILPGIVRDIGGLAYYAWTSMLFVVGSIGGAVIAPSLLARLGSRGSYRVALILFVAGSLVCAAAPAMSVLLIGRLLQGIGGGLLPALAYATIRRLFPEPLWSRGISMLSGVWGIAALTGPFVGGLFAAYDAWRLAFLIDAPIGLAFAVVSERVLPRNDRAEEPAAVPLAQLLVFVAAVSALASAGIIGDIWLSAAAIVVGFILLGGVLQLNRRSPRLLPTGAFDPRSAIGAVSATMALLSIGSSTTAFVPYLLQGGGGFSAMVGGYMTAVQATSWTTAALLTASAGKSAVRGIIILGPVAMVAGTATMTWALSTGSLLPVALGLMLVGSGIGMGWAHMGTLMMGAAAASERDIASSFISTTQLVALALGSAFAGIVVNAAGLATATTSAEVVHAGCWLYAVFTLAPLAAFVISLRILRAFRLR